MISRINPRQVEAFHKVILTGGITQAASIMNITQPAVSRLIKDFEYALNLKLFKREGRSLEPREEALRLFCEVGRLYFGLDHIARTAEEIRQSKSRVLRIGAVSALATLCTETILPPLLRTNSELSLFMEVENTTTIIDMVLSNQYDVGFIHGRPQLGGLKADLLGVAKSVAVLSPNHPLADTTVLTLANLTQYRAILPCLKTVMREQLSQQLIQHNYKFHSLIETSLSKCCAMAANGLGIGIVDLITAMTSSARIIVKPIEPAIEVSWLAIFPLKNTRGLMVEHIVNHMREIVSNFTAPEYG